MTDFTEFYPASAPAVEEPAGKPGLLLRDRRGRIRVKDPARDRALKRFLSLFVILGVAALFFLNLDWAQVWEGVLRIPEAIGKLCKVDFSQIDVTFTSLFESIAVAILSTVYSLIGGMVLAVFLAKNLTPFKGMAAALSAVLTFLRAIPSIIWVLLILVCVGFGPSAGIIGICIFSTSFFARSFAQCYEEVPQETLEALRAMGAGRVKVFFSAVLPSAFTGMLAWTSISFESNFEASAVLGTVGAGGIGYVISNCMTRYAYGQAIVAIALVLAFTYAMELGFTAIKERWENRIGGAMEPRRFSKIIEKCPAERVKELARPIVEQHQVTVIRKPAKTLVMVRMRETVAKAEFYLGELLAAEAMVELEGAKGFSLLMGDDLDKAFSAAVLDALRRSQLPQWETVRLALEREEERQRQEERREICRHNASRVQFNTLDVEY